MSKKFWIVGFVCHVAFVTSIGVGAYLGKLPSLSQYFHHYDLVMHLVLIGLLAFFLDGALRFRPLLGGRPRLAWLHMAPVIILTIAGIEELAQALSPNRSCNLWDFVADALGVILFSYLAWRLDQRWQRAPSVPTED